MLKRFRVTGVYRQYSQRMFNDDSQRTTWDNSTTRKFFYFSGFIEEPSAKIDNIYYNSEQDLSIFIQAQIPGKINSVKFIFPNNKVVDAEEFVSQQSSQKSYLEIGRERAELLEAVQGRQGRSPLDFDLDFIHGTNWGTDFNKILSYPQEQVVRRMAGSSIYYPEFVRDVSQIPRDFEVLLYDPSSNAFSVEDFSSPISQNLKNTYKVPNYIYVNEEQQEQIEDGRSYGSTVSLPTTYFVASNPVIQQEDPCIEENLQRKDQYKNWIKFPDHREPGINSVVADKFWWIERNPTNGITNFGFWTAFTDPIGYVDWGIGATAINGAKQYLCKGNWEGTQSEYFGISWVKQSNPEEYSCNNYNGLGRVING